MRKFLGLAACITVLAIFAPFTVASAYDHKAPWSDVAGTPYDSAGDPIFRASGALFHNENVGQVMDVPLRYHAAGNLIRELAACPAEPAYQASLIAKLTAERAVVDSAGTITPGHWLQHNVSGVGIFFVNDSSPHHYIAYGSSTPPNPADAAAIGEYYALRTDTDAANLYLFGNHCAPYLPTPTPTAVATATPSPTPPPHHHRH